MNCKKHPNYQALRSPRTECQDCWDMYKKKNPSRKVEEPVTKKKVCLRDIEEAAAKEAEAVVKAFPPEKKEKKDKKEYQTIPGLAPNSEWTVTW
jgi:hypothetical protein